MKKIHTARSLTMKINSVWVPFDWGFFPLNILIRAEKDISNSNWTELFSTQLISEKRWFLTSYFAKFGSCADINTLSKWLALCTFLRIKVSAQSQTIQFLLCINCFGKLNHLNPLFSFVCLPRKPCLYRAIPTIYRPFEKIYVELNITSESKLIRKQFRITLPFLEKTSNS